MGSLLQRIENVMETAIFKNRREGGRQLAKALIKRGYKGENTLVLGIPRGGLLVADEVAKALIKKEFSPFPPVSSGQ